MKQSRGFLPRYTLPALGLAVLGLAAPTAQGQQIPIQWLRHDLQGGIQSVSYSPDGTLLAYSASGDPAIRICAVADGSLVRSLTAATNPNLGVPQVAFGPWRGGAAAPALASAWNRFQSSGGYIFTFGGLELWDGLAPPSLATGTHAGSVTSLAWAPDGRHIASGGADRTVMLWDAATGHRVRTFPHGAAVLAVAFSPDGTLLASGGNDNDIKLWRVADGHLLRTLSDHADDVRALAFSPDGAVLASGAGGFDGSADHDLRLWRVADGALLGLLAGHRDWILDLDFALDGALLGSTSRDGTLRFWSMATGRPLLRYRFENELPLCLEVSPDDRTFAFGLNTGEVILARMPLVR